MPDQGLARARFFRGFTAIGFRASKACPPGSQLSRAREVVELVDEEIVGIRDERVDQILGITAQGCQIGGLLEVEKAGATPGISAGSLSARSSVVLPTWRGPVSTRIYGSAILRRNRLKIGR